MENYQKETRLLDYSHPSIQQLLCLKQWETLPTKEAIQQIYNFVQNDISFGYNRKDDILASEILEDGYGQCNTKSILLMALLRANRIPCRMHGLIVTKYFQKGCLKNIYYLLSPTNIVHGWVEVYYQDKWHILEGVILDQEYLKAIKNRYPNHRGLFQQYAISTTHFENLNVDWDENDTFVQNASITEELGVFDTPNQFLSMYSQNLSKFKEISYSKVIRHLMNRNIKKLKNTISKN